MIVDQAVYRDGVRQACSDLSDALGQLRAEGRPDDDFLWVGLKDPTPEEFELVRRELDLHPLAAEDILSGNQRAKIETYDSTILAVVKTLRYVEETSDIETGEILGVVAPPVVVTSRHGHVAPLAGVRHRLEQHERELLRLGPLSVLHAMVDTVVDTYQQIDEEVADDLEAIEREVFGGYNGVASTTIYRLKREVLEFRRAAAPLRVPLQMLTAKGGPVAERELRLHFRDVADHLAQVLQDVDSYDALLSDVLSTHLSQQAMRQNDDMRKISAYAAMITVPTLIAGIYGMNFDVMPELHWAFGYPLVLVVMLITVFLLWRTFKKSGWL